MDDKQQRETLFEKHKENVYFRWGLTAFVVLAACIVLGQFVTKLTAVFDVLRSLMGTLAPVIYGLGIAYLLDPIVNRVQKLLQPRLERVLKQSGKAEKLSRVIGIVVSLVLATVVVWALLSMVLPQLLDSLNTIIGNLPSYYNTLSSWVTNLINDNLQMADYTEQLMDAVYEYLTGWLTDTLLPKVQTLVISLTTSVVGVAKALLNLIIGVIISIYLLMGKKSFLSQAKKLCYGLLGQKRAGYVCNVCSFANQAFGGFIGGKIIDSLIIGVLSFVVLSIMKMPYTMLISVIIGVTNIIPFFGPFLGAIPSALLLLVINPMQCLYFIIFVLILQQIDGNIIGPVILGDATGVSGFWVVVSILVFGSFFGVVGMIIAVPLFAVIYKIITEVVNWMLTTRGLSTVTEAYEKWNYPPRPHPSHWRVKNRKKDIKTVLHHQAEAEPPESENDTDKETPG
ncbi:MAG: AI-2E family transporter [Oscillospiraceae bacterium]|nr:AI-2E family transporter [Oscillospiraceae bacterium]